MKRTSNTPKHKGQIEDTEKKHRIAFTSQLSFKQLNESGQRETEKNKVFQLLLKSAPLTSRQIAHKLTIERTNITRAIRDLMDVEKIRIAFLAKCETTNKTVQYYTTTNCRQSND